MKFLWEIFILVVIAGAISQGAFLSLENELEEV